jgi:hypothetical protein
MKMIRESAEVKAISELAKEEKKTIAAATISVRRP